MAELTTIARPYAQAVFSLAKQTGQLTQWSEMLQFVSSVYVNPEVQLALANPKFTKEDVEQLLLALCGERVNNPARNLLIVLVQNDRLSTLPEIVQLYEHLREREENILEATIESAFPLDESQLLHLVARLEQRTGRKIRANVAVAPQLIGGVKVQIADDVWDGSVRGQLDSMAAALVS
jgi:F-type H+-transporting ATPase subunit delta